MRKQLTIRRTGAASRPERRGVVMVIVLMVMSATLLVGLAAMLTSSTDMKISFNYKRGTMAFFAAEAGVQRAIAELREDQDWSDGFELTDQDNGTGYEVDVTHISSQLASIRAQGSGGASRRTIEVIVNIDSAYSHALNIGGDLTMAGKPRISVEGVRLNGDAFMDLDNGTPSINVFAPADSVITFADGSETEPVQHIDTPPFDTSGARLSDSDWNELAANAPDAWSHDEDGIPGNADTTVTINNLNFENVPAAADGKRTIYVDGDVTLTGSVAGIGTVIATGKIIGQGGFHTSGTPTISFISRDDVLLNFDTNAQSELNGLTYAEGDYEMHGKIKYTGVVTSFGSAIIQNPSEFTNNNDPNYWYTYSAAYSIVADPVDVLLWQEVMG
ncbi:pilus assembly PilX N-terminal domain-containing protein [bacterium]|nr:pilus assembly PilX N-terminal domain-containing protein [bacterium]